MNGYDILKKIGYDNDSITSTEKWIAEEIYKLKQSPETGQVDVVFSVPDDVKEFIRIITLELQSHRSKSEIELDKLFQECYKMYVKYEVEKAQ